MHGDLPSLHCPVLHPWHVPFTYSNPALHGQYPVDETQLTHPGPLGPLVQSEHGTVPLLNSPDLHAVHLPPVVNPFDGVHCVHVPFTLSHCEQRGPPTPVEHDSHFIPFELNVVFEQIEQPPFTIPNPTLHFKQ